MDIVEIAQMLNKCGGKLYLVGGAVRDELLNREICDEDYCITGVTEEEFEKLFPKAFSRGKSFKVYDIEGKEFALARLERKTGIGHKEFEIITNKNITIEQDLARRDITINSMAKDIITGKIVDPYNGKKDLENKIIRATSTAFSEDPLRVYRVARFASQLKFEVENNTLQQMNNLKQELNTLSKERVFDEFRKALAQDKPSIFFEVLRKANVLDVHFKDIYKLIGVLQPPKYHPEGDAYNHTMIVLDTTAKYTKDLKIRFAALTHDFGKGLTPKEEYPHHYVHDIKGESVVKEFGKKLGIPTIWIKCGVTSSKEHMRGGIFFKMTPTKQVQFLERVEKSTLGLDGLQVIVDADKGIREQVNDFASLGKQVLQEINGKYILNKYGNIDGLQIKQKLYEERIKYLKNCIVKYDKSLNKKGKYLL